jgi:hypothetical protein
VGVVVARHACSSSQASVSDTSSSLAIGGGASGVLWAAGNSSRTRSGNAELQTWFLSL